MSARFRSPARDSLHRAHVPARQHGMSTLGEERTKFTRLFTQSIFKWVQAPLAIHVGSLELDRERALQLPVVQRTEWTGK